MLAHCTRSALDAYQMSDLIMIVVMFPIIPLGMLQKDHLKKQDVEWCWWYLLSILMNDHDITTSQRWCPVSIDQHLTGRQEARRVRVLKGMGMFNLLDTNDILVSMSILLRRTISQCRSRLGHVCCCHSGLMIWVTLHSVTLHPTLQKHDRHTSCHHLRTPLKPMFESCISALLCDDTSPNDRTRFQSVTGCETAGWPNLVAKFSIQTPDIWHLFFFAISDASG